MVRRHIADAAVFACLACALLPGTASAQSQINGVLTDVLAGADPATASWSRSVRGLIPSYVTTVKWTSTLSSNLLLETGYLENTLSDRNSRLYQTGNQEGSRHA